mmetsp:Transcript_29816/g.73441  ORF Transcript_29816/g.73441 Transcript_29816/m.73441 type:complete len:204 (+) Transcript_29816:358-969(+)
MGAGRPHRPRRVRADLLLRRAEPRRQEGRRRFPVLGRLAGVDGVRLPDALRRFSGSNVGALLPGLLGPVVPVALAASLPRHDGRHARRHAHHLEHFQRPEPRAPRQSRATHEEPHSSVCFQAGPLPRGRPGMTGGWTTRPDKGLDTRCPRPQAAPSGGGRASSHPASARGVFWPLPGPGGSLPRRCGFRSVVEVAGRCLAAPV